MSEEKLVKSLRDDLSKKPSVTKHLLEIYKDVVQGYQDQNERADDILDYWDLYNCKLNAKQFYNGNSEIYVPIIAEAVDARKTRFCNQIFPINGRNVECTTETGDAPYAHMALLETYIGKANLRDKVMPALLKNGDVEGQYTIYVTWNKTTRHTMRRVTKGALVAGMEMKDVDEVDDIEEQEVVDEYPDVQVISDIDLLVLPATSDSIDEAIEKGGSVTVAMRLSKREIKKMAKDGELNKDAAESFLKGFGAGDATIMRNTKKEMASEAGIRVSMGKKFALVFQTWSKVKVGGEYRLCKTYFGNSKTILGCTLNPYWNDRVPVLSVPLNKQAGVFKGVSPLKKCAPLQYAANDAVNEGMDSATYSLLPIVMTDPEKNPRVGSMVMNLAAIWETSPNDTKFVTFPQLWKDAFEIVASSKNEIFQALSVNPAMLPSGNNSKKKNQAEIANEQQVDVLTTADAVTVIERGILTPLLERFFEYDHQFRTEPMSVRKYGELGIQAAMEDIPPVQMDSRYHFKWLGVEAARNAQQLQQQISFMNVLRGIPPEMYQGRKLDMTPLIEVACQNIYGPRLAPRIFKDIKSQLSINPEMENELLLQQFPVEVHTMDDDKDHLQKHMIALKEGDPDGVIREHIVKHQTQMKNKQEALLRAQMARSQAPGAPGTPGPGKQAGIAGVPRPGSVPQGPANLKQPPGALHRDDMAGGGIMPRKM